MTAAYATTASQDPDVQNGFYAFLDNFEAKYPEAKDRWRTGNVEADIYNFLMAQDLPVEMSDEEYTDLMIWHRGLAVPAARNLDDEDVQRGRQLFREIGCATCHRPSWTTGPDEFNDPNNFFARSQPDYLALQRLDPAPAFHAERYPRRMVPHDPSLGQRSVPDMLGTQRPPARCPRP